MKPYDQCCFLIGSIKDILKDCTDKDVLSAKERKILRTIQSDARLKAQYILRRQKHDAWVATLDPADL